MADTKMMIMFLPEHYAQMRKPNMDVVLTALYMASQTTSTTGKLTLRVGLVFVDLPMLKSLKGIGGGQRTDELSDSQYLADFQYQIAERHSLTGVSRNTQQFAISSGKSTSGFIFITRIYVVNCPRYINEGTVRVLGRDVCVQTIAPLIPMYHTMVAMKVSTPRQLLREVSPTPRVVGPNKKPITIAAFRRLLAESQDANYSRIVHRVQPMRQDDHTNTEVDTVDAYMDTVDAYMDTVDAYMDACILQSMDSYADTTTTTDASAGAPNYAYIDPSDDTSMIRTSSSTGADVDIGTWTDLCEYMDPAARMDAPNTIIQQTQPTETMAFACACREYLPTAVQTDTSQLADASTHATATWTTLLCTSGIGCTSSCPGCTTDFGPERCSEIGCDFTTQPRESQQLAVAIRLPCTWCTVENTSINQTPVRALTRCTILRMTDDVSIDARRLVQSNQSFCACRPLYTRCQNWIRRVVRRPGLYTWQLGRNSTFIIIGLLGENWILVPMQCTMCGDEMLTFGYGACDLCTRMRQVDYPLVSEKHHDFYLFPVALVASGFN